MKFKIGDFAIHKLDGLVQIKEVLDYGNNNILYVVSDFDSDLGWYTPCKNLTEATTLLKELL